MQPCDSTSDGSCFLLLFVLMGLRVMPALPITDSPLSALRGSLILLGSWHLITMSSNQTFDSGPLIQSYPLWTSTSAAGASVRLSHYSWTPSPFFLPPLLSVSLMAPDVVPYISIPTQKWSPNHLHWIQEYYLPSGSAGSLHHIQSNIIWKHFLLKHSSHKVRELHLFGAYSTPGILPRTRVEETDQIEE